MDPTEEARRALLTPHRDQIIATDQPLPEREATVATAAAAAFGPAEGGPLQQVAALARLSTNGEVTLSPAAIRQVRDMCEFDEPLNLRGGVRLNRIKVHEVVPPLTNHPLNRHGMASILPNRPDPLRALAALAPLVPAPLRRVIADDAKATAAALAARRCARGASSAGRERRENPASRRTTRSSKREIPTKVPAPSTPRTRPKRPSIPPARRRGFRGQASRGGRGDGCRVSPGRSTSTGEFCVSVPDSSSFAMMATTATSAITTLLLNFPGSSLTRVTNDVMLHRDADRITGGCGGGGEGIVYYCDFVAPSKASPATDAAAAANAPPASPFGAKDPSGSGSQDWDPSAMATAFALAARAAMVHLGHLPCTVGVASGKAVFCPVGGDLQRSEWSVVGEAVQRAQRLAVFGEAEVLCDLSVVRACAGWPIDFDPVPHAAGDDISRARNLVAGSLDLIIGRSTGASRSRWHVADASAASVVASAEAFAGVQDVGRVGPRRTRRRDGGRRRSGPVRAHAGGNPRGVRVET